MNLATLAAARAVAVAPTKRGDTPTIPIPAELAAACTRLLDVLDALRALQSLEAEKRLLTSLIHPVAEKRRVELSRAERRPLSSVHLGAGLTYVSQARYSDVGAEDLAAMRAAGLSQYVEEYLTCVLPGLDVLTPEHIAQLQGMGAVLTVKARVLPTLHAARTLDAGLDATPAAPQNVTYIQRRK